MCSESALVRSLYSAGVRVSECTRYLTLLLFSISRQLFKCSSRALLLLLMPQTSGTTLYLAAIYSIGFQTLTMYREKQYLGGNDLAVYVSRLSRLSGGKYFVEIVSKYYFLLMGILF